MFFHCNRIKFKLLQGPTWYATCSCLSPHLSQPCLIYSVSNPAVSFILVNTPGGFPLEHLWCFFCLECRHKACLCVQFCSQLMLPFLREASRSVLSCSSSVWLFVTLWIVTRQTSLSLGFSRQEYWSGLPFPSPGDLPYPGIKPTPLNVSCIGRQFLYH